MNTQDNELDEILHDVYLAGWNDKLLDSSPTYVPQENQEKLKAKQALTQLIDTKVLEAKFDENKKIDKSIDDTYIYLTKDLPSLIGSDHDIAVRKQHKDEMHKIIADRITELTKEVNSL